MLTKISVQKSPEWLKAQRLATGQNVCGREDREIDTCQLSETSRATLLAADDEYQTSYSRLGYSSSCESFHLGSYGNYVQFASDCYLADIPSGEWPGFVDALLADSVATILTRHQENAARYEQEKAERERMAAERNAKLADAIAAFMQNPDARCSATDTRPIHWCEIDGLRIDRTDPGWDTLRDEVHRRQDADNVKAAREAQRRNDSLSTQIAEWVQQNGTDSQKARLAASLLPDDEIIEAIRREALQPLDDFPRYQKLTSSEVRALCNDRTGEDVEFSCSPATEATDEQFRKLVEISDRIQCMYPDATVTLRRHVGEWDCGDDSHPLHVVVRYGVYVYVAINEVNATAEYAAE